MLKFAKEQESKFIEALQYIGETFVNEARSKRTYQDQTGNLRASIGYAIVKNGKTMKFSVSRAATEGKIEAAEFVTSKVQEGSRSGIYLIVFAGMEYALYVEAKGYDVLTGSRPSRTEVISLFKDLIGNE
jgi:hypothetical protein